MYWAYRRGFYYIVSARSGRTGEQFFPRFILTVCKIQPEILINIIKYPLIVKMYNQCIFYNIKNFWLKLTHCENKSWKKLSLSFLDCKSSTILQRFVHKIPGRIIFPPACRCRYFFNSELPCRTFFFKTSPPIKS